MLPTWLRTLGSLARDLTAMGLTVNKLRYALYLRGLPPRFASLVTSVLSATFNLSDSKLSSDDLQAAILKFDTDGISGSKDTGIRREAVCDTDAWQSSCTLGISQHLVPILASQLKAAHIPYALSTHSAFTACSFFVNQSMTIKLSETDF